MIARDECSTNCSVHRMNPDTDELEHWNNFTACWERCFDPNSYRELSSYFVTTTYESTWCEPYKGMEE